MFPTNWEDRVSAWTNSAVAPVANFKWAWIMPIIKSTVEHFVDEPGCQRPISSRCQLAAIHIHHNEAACQSTGHPAFSQCRVEAVCLARGSSECRVAMQVRDSRVPVSTNDPENAAPIDAWSIIHRCPRHFCLCPVPWLPWPGCFADSLCRFPGPFHVPGSANAVAEPETSARHVIAAINVRN